MNLIFLTFTDNSTNLFSNLFGLVIVIILFYAFVGFDRNFIQKRPQKISKTVEDHEAFLQDIPARFPNKEFIYCERCQCKHHPYVPCDARYANVKCKNCGEPGHFECFLD